MIFGVGNTMSGGNANTMYPNDNVGEFAKEGNYIWVMRYLLRTELISTSHIAGKLLS